MKCLRPIQATCIRDPETKMILDVSFRDEYTEPIQFGCGCCIYCQCRLRAQRTALMLMELETKAKGSFLTLTYNDDNLPKKYGLNYHDLSLFIHSYQRFLEREGIKGITYVKAGEYGPSTSRPHYHVNFFGLNLDTARESYKEVGKYYTSDRINNIWKKGYTTIISANEVTCKYTAGYTVKKIIVEDKNRVFNSQRVSYGRNHHAEENGFTPYLPRGHVKDLDEYALKEYRNKLKKQRLQIIDNRKYDNPLAPSRSRIYYDKEKQQYMHEAKIRFSDGFGDQYYKKYKDDFHKGFLILGEQQKYRVPLKFMNKIKQENYKIWLTLKKQGLENIKHETVTYESDKSFNAYMFTSHTSSSYSSLNFDVLDEKLEDELERECEFESI